MNLKESILSLSRLFSVSGHETVSNAELEALTEGLFDQHTSDPMGNHLFVKKCHRENAPKILLDVHFDEIGMMVTQVKEGGFLTVTPIGGVDPRILQAGEVLIYGKETLFGVITATPPHFRQAGDSQKLQPMDALYVDTGYDKETLEELCPVGTPVGFKPVYGELLNDRLFGKAFDDKACGACVLCGLAAVPAHELVGDVYFLFSAQEELGTRGAALAAFDVRPDYCLVIDVTHAAVPEVTERVLSPMESGVVIDLAPITDRKLTHMIRELCDQKGIPYALQACVGSTGTNANVLGICADGIPTALCSLPIKNMHSPSEVLSLKDAQAVADLVTAFVSAKNIGEVYAQ